MHERLWHLRIRTSWSCLADCTSRRWHSVLACSSSHFILSILWESLRMLTWLESSSLCNLRHIALASCFSFLTSWSWTWRSFTCFSAFSLCLNRLRSLPHSSFECSSSVYAGCNIDSSNPRIILVSSSWKKYLWYVLLQDRRNTHPVRFIDGCAQRLGKGFHSLSRRIGIEFAQPINCIMGTFFRGEIIREGKIQSNGLVK